ncbi:MAG: ABC transporter ATP-binding protein [Gammaproteobacteria bacterium]|nr:ATP-binding cassette domain-containing protein [Beggiatoa alba]PCH61594.1 MAG: ABC transporter ATP-binding protein [Gammaproteobacteria bacterium]
MIRLIDVSLQRGTQILLEKANLTVHTGAKLGVIGANGSGKSSLFKLLLGQLHVDAGDLFMPGQWRIAHMAQEVSASARSAVDYVLDGDKELRRLQAAIAKEEAEELHEQLGELYAKLDAVDGFNAHYRAEQLLHGLGFKQSQLTESVASFSGGWRIRLNLAQALMCQSDLLLLDEPTNHLDLDASVWLEQWLRNYAGTLLIISHDRDFLDNAVDGIVHIEHKQCWSYSGNYSAFERLRAERLAQQQVTFEKQQRRKAEIHQFVARFSAKASKARQAQSRIKELQRMEDIAPAHVDSPFDFHFLESKQSFSALISLHDARLGYDNKTIINHANIELLPGTRIGLLGPNGAGKSTLIKSLVGTLSLLSGERVQSDNLMLGYFAQHQLEALDIGASALLHIQRLSPDVREQEIRSFLGGFNFHGDKATDPIRDFSGGEKARLALSLIVWQKPNLLLLDEPTNHLDLEMCHALTVALQGYGGALVVISHDRHLLRNTVDQFYLVAEGRLAEFDGDIADYQQWLKDHGQKVDDNKNTESDSKKDKGVTQTVPRIDKKEQRQHAAEKRKRLNPLTSQIKKLEQRIEKKQKQLSEVEEQLADNSVYEESNKALLADILYQQRGLQQEINRCEEEWITLSDELEQLQNEN